MNINFSQFQRLGSPRSRCWQIQGSGEDPLPGSYTAGFSLGGRDKGALQGLFYKDTNPIHEGSILLT